MIYMKIKEGQVFINCPLLPSSSVEQLIAVGKANQFAYIHISSILIRQYGSEQHHRAN